MTHPMRHIIVYQSRIVFLDFEKCSWASATPRNVTQVCQVRQSFSHLQTFICMVVLFLDERRILVAL
jgi:predicted Ser/Thr protein kinase